MKAPNVASNFLLAPIAALALTGCISLAPEHERPGLPVPSVYPVSATQDGGEDRDISPLQWRNFFTDPAMQQLIAAALEHNRDLRKALLRVEEARAAHGIQRSERMPAVSVGAQGVRSRVPGDLNPTWRSQVGSEYRAEVGLTSWELDLWGRVRSLEQAALQNWLATEAGGQAVQAALINEVAQAWLNLRELDQRLAVTRQTVASREQSHEIFQRRYAVGATAKLDVTQVQTLLNQAQALQAQLGLQRAQQINALRILAGDAAPGLLEQSATGMPQLAPLHAGLPSELLVNRPDIQAAEHQLRAANANIGAARAAFFPRIALTGSFGSASAELDDLFSSGSKAWAFRPSISLPIFDGGRRRAGLELSKVRRELAVTGYEQAIENAFRDVADALAARHWLADQLQARQVARDAQAERARLAQLRYDNGSAAYLEVLDAQRDLLDAEQQLISTARALSASQVSLYAALGGGAGPLPDNSGRPVSSNSE